ncbi:hypothetical protein IWQ60_006215 [Tieghemiomyces parasiticus]|uniref:GPI anchored serine-threonine rich protein n=1 Tax=Tieghemiomyces parasiticus TaxID=78921 RepID=A0A9W8A4T8_9FUNG|nr:hypothetical protein IWQ60_006215 [Tieghemiomyces parasiticus]
MKSFAAPIALLALAAGRVQAECSTQAVVDSCLQTTNSAFNACAFGDFQCQCTTYSSVVACYDGCPDDQTNMSAKTLAQGSLQNYCGHASAQASVSAATQTTASAMTATGAASTKAASATHTSTSADDGQDDTSAGQSIQPAAFALGAVALALSAFTC